MFRTQTCIFLFLMQFSRIELDGAVKNYKGALFRSCSSVAEGNTKLQLFIQHITEWFDDVDPFSGTCALTTQSIPSARGSGLQEEPLVRSATPTQNSQQRYPRTPRVIGSAHSYADFGSSLASSVCTCHLSAPHPSEGWYVVYRAAVPGIYRGL